MRNFILDLEKKINKGLYIEKKEAIVLGGLKGKEELQELFEAADRVCRRFKGNAVDLCSIMNAKSGKCSEDCKFCAQSVHYNTNVKEYGVVSEKEALRLAKENKEAGVNRFSLVTSGRGLNGKEFDRIIDIYNKLNKELKIDLCASLGILNYDQLVKLKDVGVSMYHHNLESSRSYYDQICTTHSYDERIETINNARKAGLSVCSGGIIGMGETIEDRIDLAFQLRDLGIDSIPINILNPIKGTPLENMIRLNQEEILKTIAIFRFINPKANIRLAGGRNLIDYFGKKCFKVGVNATITGNYLTTSGNKICDDITMIKDLGLEVKSND